MGGTYGLSVSPTILVMVVPQKDCKHPRPSRLTLVLGPKGGHENCDGTSTFGHHLNQQLFCCDHQTDADWC